MCCFCHDNVILDPFNLFSHVFFCSAQNESVSNSVERTRRAVISPWMRLKESQIKSLSRRVKRQNTDMRIAETIAEYNNRKKHGCLQIACGLIDLIGTL